jgi:hypothetical protein
MCVCVCVCARACACAPAQFLKVEVIQLGAEY